MTRAEESSMFAIRFFSTFVDGKTPIKYFDFINSYSLRCERDLQLQKLNFMRIWYTYE